MGLIAVASAYLKNRKQWESICDRCALCCHERSLEGGALVVSLSEPCEFLDESSGLCRVYEERFTCQPRCRKITLRRALFDEYMPPSCAYVRLFRPLLHTAQNDDADF